MQHIIIESHLLMSQSAEFTRRMSIVRLFPSLDSICSVHLDCSAGEILMINLKLIVSKGHA